MEFGELIEPDTRAFWENYDENVSESDQPVSLSWKWMDDSVSDADQIENFMRFFVIEGRNIFDFVETTILKKQSPICQINGYKTSVYKLPETGDFLCVTEDNDLDQSAEMTELLSPWLMKAKHTYAFTFQSAYSYNTNQEFDKRCFVRTIPNSITANHFDFVAPMEDCNIINGVSAGVSTWRYVHKFPFECYAVYMDCMQVDSVIASKVSRLFNSLGLKCDTNYVLKDVNKSNLYV